MFEDLNASDIAKFHDDYLSNEQLSLNEFNENSLWFWIKVNHYNNCQLWNEEDLARRRDVADSEIVKNKRHIDNYNQARNDAIELIDEFILLRLQKIQPISEAWFNSETAGSIIDRLSILSLKIFNMNKQTQRLNIEDSLKQEAIDKVARLRLQRSDLQYCFNQLLYNCSIGKAYYRIYRQFKMYNDPRFNLNIIGNKLSN